MLEYRYAELISSILSENVSDPESRMESIVTASLDSCDHPSISPYQYESAVVNLFVRF